MKDSKLSPCRRGARGLLPDTVPEDVLESAPPGFRVAVSAAPFPPEADLPFLPTSLWKNPPHLRPPFEEAFACSSGGGAVGASFEGFPWAFRFFTAGLCP
jgi:hypothetical protein